MAELAKKRMLEDLFGNTIKYDCYSTCPPSLEMKYGSTCQVKKLCFISTGNTEVLNSTLDIFLNPSPQVNILDDNTFAAENIKNLQERQIGSMIHPSQNH